MKLFDSPQYLAEPQYIEGCVEENRQQNESDQRLQAETFPIKEDLSWAKDVSPITIPLRKSTVCCYVTSIT